MSEKFLKITKAGRSIQRLHGPQARAVFARDWEPYGWEIVGEPQATKGGAREPEPEAVHVGEAGDGEAAAEVAPARKKRARADADAGGES